MNYENELLEKQAKYFNLLQRNCDIYVNEHSTMPVEKHDDLLTSIFMLICRCCFIQYNPNKIDGFIDTEKNINNINTDFVKKNKNSKFYVLNISDEFLKPNVTDIMFHPNGNTGCILANDDYMFGIRCDHLIWIEGESEVFGRGYMVVGNHKGTTVVNFVSAINELQNRLIDENN